MGQVKSDAGICGGRWNRRIVLKLGILLALMMLCFSLCAQAASSKGWHKTSDGKRYYVKADGKQAGKGWLKVGKKTYYIDQDGYRVTMLQQIGGKFYYFHKTKGYRMTGWVKIGNQTYRFHKTKGYRMTGLSKIDGKYYYLDPAQDGARISGWKTIGKYRYYFLKKGAAKTGWLKQNGKRYYFLKNGRMVKGWKTISGEKYYFDKTTGAVLTGWQTIGKTQYYFNSKGKVLKNAFTSDGVYMDADGKALHKSTLKKFLKIAIQPVGSTMYVWGGGWGSGDTAAGKEAVTIGVSSRWKSFFEAQSAYYDYRNTRFQIHDGLDCSGFVGWAIYNAFNTTNGNAGYVMLAQNMARTYASMGWGTYSAPGTFSDFRAGDILSSSSHVYIVIGQCSDGSVVLVHSSPKGVQINGTTTRSGNTNSQAASLAKKYMQKYYPAWCAKYSIPVKDASYLTRYGRMRWKLSGKCMMSDPAGYASKDAKAILKNLFGG
ncbi:MAG: N-acetylmuramoyl-L-alanine amidase family protein [Lachnospiraceae bacterium]|nr:N-acetylmuramoyl-L-alanine amidase family protein [Lachnospiraceae bacterium]